MILMIKRIVSCISLLLAFREPCPATALASPVSTIEDVVPRDSAKDGGSIVLTVKFQDSTARDSPLRFGATFSYFYSLKFPLDYGKKEVTDMVYDGQTVTYSYPGSHQPVYVEVRCSVPGNPLATVMERPFFSKKRFFLLERGDSVYMEVRKNDVVFFGSSAPKLKFQRDLFKLEDSLLIDRSLSDETYLRDVDNRFRQIGRLADAQIKYLASEKERLCDRTYHMLSQQIIGKYLFNLASETSYLFNMETNRKSKNKHLYKLYKEYTDGGLCDTDYGDNDSPYYMDYLLIDEILRFKMGNLEMGNVRNIGADDFFGIISGKYEGRARQRLLVMAASYLINHPGSDPGIYLQKIGKYMTDSLYADIFQKSLANNMRYKYAYDFSLGDIDGKKVRLSDFRGKVVLIDYWFSGCLPCKILKKHMDEFLRVYNNLDVVLISINIDRDIEIWKKGIASGEYAHADAINLYTGGEGWSHPTMTHYNFVGVPQMLLIDKNGKLVSANLPRPNAFENMEALARLIRQAQ